MRSRATADLYNLDKQEHEMNEQSANLIDDVLTIGVPVTDHDRALEFYLDKLGFEKRRDFPGQQVGGRWIEVAPPGATVTVALVPTQESLPAGVETGIRLQTRDAAAVRTELQSRGVRVGELLQWPGVPPMFELHDQDGNGFRIVQAG